MSLSNTTDRPRRSGVAVIASLLALVVLAACGSGGSGDRTGSGGAGDTAGTLPPEQSAPIDGGTLVVGLNSESAGWNPVSDRWGTGPALAGSAMFEPLATLDANLDAQPWLATAWEPNADFTSWTVTLRDGVRFHDGEPFDAAAVKLNIDRYVASPLSGLVLKTMIAGATVVDEHTVRVDLLSPWAAFPTSFLAGPTAFMMAPASLAEGADASHHPIGTGPFRFDSWVPNTALKLVRNDDYWRPGEPHLDALELRPIVDDSGRTAALQSGTLGMMATVSASDAVSLEGDFTVVRDWDTETSLLLVNTRPTAGGQPNPMANPHARRAIAHATDAEAIAALVGDGVEVPDSPFPSDSPWGDPAAGAAYPAHDVEQAKQEVAAYEADTGEQGLRVSLIGPTDQVTGTVFQALQQQWAEAGIETDVETFEAAALQMRPIGGNYQLTYGPIYASPEPDQNYTFWTSSTAKGDGEFSLNFTGFTNDVTEAALAESRSTDDKDARRAAYTRLIEQLNEQAVNIWLYFTPYSLVASPDVHGLQPASEVPFANFFPKTWWGGVWVTG